MINSFIQNILENDYASAHKSLECVIGNKIKDKIEDTILESHQPNPKWYEYADEKEVKLYFSKWKQLQGRFKDDSGILSQDFIKKKFTGSFNGFKEWIDLLEKDAPPSRKQAKQRAKEGLKVFLDNDDYYVAQVTSWEGAKLVGKGTTWCVSSEKTSHHWDDHAKREGKCVYILDKKLERQEMAKIKSQAGMGKTDRSELPAHEKIDPLYKVIFMIHKDHVGLIVEPGLALGTPSPAVSSEYRDALNYEIDVNKVNEIITSLVSKQGVPNHVFQNSPESNDSNDYYNINDQGEMRFKDGKERIRTILISYQFIKDRNIKRIYNSNVDTLFIYYKGDENLPDLDMYRFQHKIEIFNYYYKDLYITSTDTDNENHYVDVTGIKPEELFNYFRYLEGEYEPDSLEASLRRIGLHLNNGLSGLDDAIKEYESSKGTADEDWSRGVLKYRQNDIVVDINTLDEEWGYSYGDIVKKYKKLFSLDKETEHFTHKENIKDKEIADLLFPEKKKDND